MKTVEEIMSTNLTVCSPDDRLTEAAQKMKQYHVGVLPVCGENRELLGMITDRDLVLRGLAEERPASSKVSEVMSDDVFSVPSTTLLQEASTLMAEKQVRRLPVVENGRLLGIIALGDLAVEDKSNESAGHALEEISERPELH